MSIVPVIARELRSQSRQPITFLLRLAASGAICLAFWLTFSSLHPPERFRRVLSSTQTPAAVQQEFQNFGRALFGKMNLTIFIAIWILTPLAAADSISRERREGTLPLLRLTRLRPWEIVLGKSFVHMLRSSTVFLTMAPWLLIPFLFGGLSLQDFQMALVLDTTALFLAQSAGLLASTFCRDWLKAVVWALALSAFLLLGMMSRYEKILDQAFVSGSAPLPAMRFGGWTPPRAGLWSQIYPGAGGFVQKRFLIMGLLTNGTMGYEPQWRSFMGGVPQWEFQSSWQQLWMSLNADGKLVWQTGAALLLAASIAIFIASILLGALVVQRTWQETARSAFWENLRRKYFTPKYGVKAFRNRLSRSLNRNPIGWLQHYSTSARLTKYFWCMVLIVIEMVCASNSDDLYSAQTALGFFLLLGLLFSSTASFRDELETGAFELLLVTPIREAQIMFGRVRGIWQQFLPAFVIYGAGAMFLVSGWTSDDKPGAAQESLVRFAILFLSAPFIGLYFSLLRWNFLMAWVCASVLTLLVPALVRGETESSPTQMILIGQIFIAAICAWRIRGRLQNRLALSPITKESAT